MTLVLANCRAVKGKINEIQVLSYQHDILSSIQKNGTRTEIDRKPSILVP